MNYREYYTELGKLLYAVAKADNTIEPAEINELRHIVKDELTQLNGSTDEFGSSTAFATEFEFEIMDDWNIPAQQAFEGFSSYIKRTPLLPALLKKVAYRSALRIAYSFHNTNHEENSMLLRLKQLLKPTKALLT